MTKGGRVIGFRSAAGFAAALVATQIYVHAQVPAAAESLQTGIAYVRTANFAAALAELNHVVIRASLDESALVARAQLFKAEAYLALNQPDEARTSLVLALDADPAVSVSAPDVSAALMALLGELRAASAADPEAAGRSAETSGRYQDAFAAYLRAFQSLIDTAPDADSQRLRERIITVVRRLDPQPTIPQLARGHFAKADELLKAELVLRSSGTGPTEAAAAELRRAIRLAPWWGDATFKLATLLPKLQRFDEAVVNLNLYRLAEPAGYAAAVAVKSAVPVTSTIPAAIYIYWPRQSRGGTQKVLCDGFHVADLEDRHFVLLNVAPGAHTIKVQGREFPMSVEAGQTYYVRAYIGGYPARRMARLATAAEGGAEMNDKEMNANERKRTYSAECNAGAVDRTR